MCIKKCVCVCEKKKKEKRKECGVVRRWERQAGKREEERKEKD
ncbi:hypothetical protein ACU4GD_27015 [Cupriavidus basilensis]